MINQLLVDYSSFCKMDYWLVINELFIIHLSYRLLHLLVTYNT